MIQAPLSDAPTPGSTDDLTLTRERSRNLVNTFLERHHPRGDVHFWHACFGTRYRGHLVAVVIFERPSARMADDGTRVELTRFARRDDRPDNTGSWLLARAREWARFEGYSEVITYAGVAGNYGRVYEAVAFQLDCPHCEWRGHSNELVEKTVDEELAERFPGHDAGEVVDVCPQCENPPLTFSDGSGWTSHDESRDTWDDYERRKWVYEFPNPVERKGGASA